MTLLCFVALVAGVALPIAWAFVPSMPALSAGSVARRAGASLPLQPNANIVIAGAARLRLLRVQAEETSEGSSGGEEAGTARRKQVMRKKRVRKDRPASGGRASSAEAEEIPVPLDPRVKASQEDIMRREFDRTLVLEEFSAPRIVDRRRPTPAEVAAAVAANAAADDEDNDGDDDEEGEEVEKKKEEDAVKVRRGKQFQGTAAEAAAEAVKEWTGVPENLRYDPTFELPIPSETVVSLSDIATKFDGAIETDQGKSLPTLAELGKKAKGSILKRQQEEEEKMAKELEPLDDYDLSSAFLGEGRPVLGIGLPYLQSCHTVVILVTLLCAFVEFPGFPLTNFPFELREFLKQGLIVVYFINAVLAWDSIKEAKKREQSVFFWALKCFVLGALAHNELLSIRVKPQASS
jgi:hypothetical protein